MTWTKGMCSSDTHHRILRINFKFHIDSDFLETCQTLLVNIKNICDTCKLGSSLIPDAGAWIADMRGEVKLWRHPSFARIAKNGVVG